MPQHDMIIANGSGAAVRGDINDALAALGSTMKGPNAPPAPIAGMMWLDDDTPSPSVWTLKLYDGADWITIGTFDVPNNVFTPLINALTLNNNDGQINFWNSSGLVRGGYLRNLVASTQLQLLADQYGLRVGTLTARAIEIIVNNSVVAQFGASGGLVLGSPTGGDLGGGVLNATDVRVNNVPRAPMPQAGVGVGQFAHFNGGVNAAVVLPAGGTWQWYLEQINSTGIFAANGSGFSAGGTTIFPATVNVSGVGWWRRIG